MDLNVYFKLKKRPKFHMKTDMVILLLSFLRPFINAPELIPRGQIANMGLLGVKSRCWQSCVPSRGFMGNPLLVFSSSQKLPISPGSPAHSSTFCFDASKGHLSLSHLPSLYLLDVTSPSLTLTLLPGSFTYKGPVIT